MERAIYGIPKAHEFSVAEPWNRERLNVYLLSADFVLFVKLVPCSKQPRNILGIFNIVLGNEETERGKKNEYAFDCICILLGLF